MAMKRLMDILLVLPGFIVLLPIFVVIALWIRLDSQGPVFFLQERIGLNGRPFRMWKFRTMVTDAERRGKQLTVGDDPRITRAGRWLRRFKVDELPQLLNVLAGDMSLVGPRPEVARYVDRYSDSQRKVLELLPGITDPASIEYRDEAALLAQSEDPERYYVEVLMPEKIRINLAYAANASLWTDFVTILRTLGVVGRK